MKQMVEDVIPKIFSELDPHSVYIPAKDAQMVNEDLEGSFSGIGVSFNMQTDTILVVSVISGGPSEKAGLRPFDRIITINGKSFAGNNSDQATIMGKTEEGISYFEKAASEASNEVVSPVYLKKAGIAYESLKKYDDAIKAYTSIKEKYFNSMEAADIDKYITRATFLKGK